MSVEDVVKNMLAEKDVSLRAKYCADIASYCGKMINAIELDWPNFILNLMSNPNSSFSYHSYYFINKLLSRTGEILLEKKQLDEAISTFQAAITFERFLPGMLNLNFVKCLQIITVGCFARRSLIDIYIKQNRPMPALEVCCSFCVLLKNLPAKLWINNLSVLFCLYKSYLSRIAILNNTYFPQENRIDYISIENIIDNYVKVFKNNNMLLLKDIEICLGEFFNSEKILTIEAIQFEQIIYYHAKGIIDVLEPCITKNNSILNAKIHNILNQKIAVIMRLFPEAQLDKIQYLLYQQVISLKILGGKSCFQQGDEYCKTNSSVDISKKYSHYKDGFQHYRTAIIYYGFFLKQFPKEVKSVAIRNHQSPVGLLSASTKNHNTTL